MISVHLDVGANIFDRMNGCLLQAYPFFVYIPDENDKCVKYKNVQPVKPAMIGFNLTYLSVRCPQKHNILQA